MDKIVIKNLQVYGILGVNPEERVEKQPILVNVTVEQDIKKPAYSDNIQDSLDYKTLCDRIVEYIEYSSCYLIEKLIIRLADFIFAEFPSIQRLTLRIEKPKALKLAESVGIEITRTRSDPKSG